MNYNLDSTINTFTALGQRIKSLNLDDVILDAQAQNRWFTSSQIRYALDAIVVQMLDRDKLKAWAGAYDFSNVKPSRVGIIMAGNIPLVGFADLLYVLFAGCVPVVKFSSKDEVLMRFIVDTLLEIDPSLQIETLQDNSHLDALIATGSDNATRYFRECYGDLPSLLRGTMYSVAVLDNAVSDEQLRALGDDIFLHSSLGCRNVSHLFVSEDFDFSHLLYILSQREDVNDNFKDNYRQNKALKILRGEQFFDGGFFTLSQGNPQENLYISNITYSTFSGELPTNNLQCVVGKGYVDFGCAQSPELSEYADNKDVMNFLLKMI